MSALRRDAITDDAPASAFAPAPVAPYRRGFEDATYDRCWFCPYRAGSADAREYAAGHEAAGKMRRGLARQSPLLRQEEQRHDF
jgi:hypothetical protein